MRRATDRETSAANGFVLVGVLMFILVLTILGLTLFSLSAIESQFYNASRDGQRAFYAAQSGIERAKFVLSTTNRLLDAQDLTGVPIDGLVYTVAKEGIDFDSADSTGGVSWDPAHTVWIRSLAVVNGQRMLLEARFSPNRQEDDYRRLFTLSDPTQGLSVPDSVKDPSSGLTDVVGPFVQLNGALSQVSTNTAAFAPAGVQPSPIVTGDTLETPNVTPPGGYLTTWLNTAGAQTVMPVPNDQYTLDASGSPNGIGFFQTLGVADDAIHHAWSLNADPGNGVHVSGDGSITVHGICIWMVNSGMRWFRRLVINGTTDDALVIVAAPQNGNDVAEAGRGIVLGAGVVSNSVPVILVSDGGVGIEQYGDMAHGTSMRYLSVFSPQCGVLGPKSPNVMALNHDLNAPEDQPGGLIDRLSQKGYLPNSVSGTAGDLALIAGTWREIKDTDGKN